MNMSDIRHWPKAWFIIGALLILSFLIPQIVPNIYYLHIFQMMWIWLLATVSIRLLFITGQLSLCHAAFMSTGAYTSALLTVDAGWNVWLASLMGIVVTTLVAIPFGYITLRVKGGYFVLLTFAFSEVLIYLYKAWSTLTHGVHGVVCIPGPDPITIGGWTILLTGVTGRPGYYYLTVIIVLIGLLIMRRIESSRLGITLWSIRLQDTLAQSVGIRLARHKLAVFVVGAAFASICGSLFVHYIYYLDPVTFPVLLSVKLTIYCIIGGVSHMGGAIAGTAIFSTLPYFLGVADAAQPIFYGVILILVMIFLPGGIGSIPARLRVRFGKKEEVIPTAWW